MAKASSPQVSLQVHWLTVPLPHGSNLACFGGEGPLQKGEIFRKSFLEHERSNSEVSLKSLYLAGKKLFFSDFQDVSWTLQGWWMLCKEGVTAPSA